GRSAGAHAIRRDRTPRHCAGPGGRWRATGPHGRRRAQLPCGRGQPAHGDRHVSAWLFDLGNTRLKCARLGEDGRPGEARAFPHEDGALAPDWATGLPPRIEAAYVASVASSALRVALLDALAARCDRISVAATRKTWQGLRIAYDEPARLGVDRFLTLLAAHGRGGAWLVVGVGTALTIDLVDADGRHHGGRIAPSPTLMRQSLQARAAQLPASGGDYRVFANG